MGKVFISFDFVTIKKPAYAYHEIVLKVNLVLTVREFMSFVLIPPSAS